MKTADVTYQEAALEMRSFATYDEAQPGILVVHEGWGLGEHVIERSKMLANLGYVAFAADMFGEGKQLTKLDDVMTTISDLRACARAALTTLATMPQVGPRRLGGIGFCFGGTTVRELARGESQGPGAERRRRSDDPAAAGRGRSAVLGCDARLFRAGFRHISR